MAIDTMDLPPKNGEIDPHFPGSSSIGTMRRKAVSGPQEMVGLPPWLEDISMWCMKFENCEMWYGIYIYKLYIYLYIYMYNQQDADMMIWDVETCWNLWLGWTLFRKPPYSAIKNQPVSSEFTLLWLWHLLQKKECKMIQTDFMFLGLWSLDPTSLTIAAIAT